MPLTTPARRDEVYLLKDGHMAGMELRDIPAEQHEPGLTLHGSGWPLD